MGMTVQDMVAELQEAFSDKLRIRGRTLEAQIRKAGRKLPRAVRRDAIYLTQAAVLSDNPKLARMVDTHRATQAHRNVLAYVETVDIGAERREVAVGVAASIAFALLVTGVLVLFVLVQRGFV